MDLWLSSLLLAGWAVQLVVFDGLLSSQDPILPLYFCIHPLCACVQQTFIYVSDEELHGWVPWV